MLWKENKQEPCVQPRISLQRALFRHITFFTAIKKPQDVENRIEFKKTLTPGNRL